MMITINRLSSMLGSHFLTKYEDDPQVATL